MIKAVKKIPLHLVKDSLSTQTPMPFLIIIVRAVILMKISSSQMQPSVTSCYAQGSVISYLEGSNFLIAAVSTITKQVHFLWLLWGCEAQGDFTHCQ